MGHVKSLCLQCFGQAAGEEDIAVDQQDALIESWVRAHCLASLPRSFHASMQCATTLSMSSRGTVPLPVRKRPETKVTANGDASSVPSHRSPWTSSQAPLTGMATAWEPPA